MDDLRFGEGPAGPMSTLDTVARRLSTSGYEVISATGKVCFEDASVLGFVAEFESVAQLLNGWKEAEDAFLRDRASGLRRDRRKAWNVYSIFLTPERAFAAQERDLVLVEENFQATRKIARAGIATDRDIENALGVLFPIRYRVSLRSENALGLVTSRLSALPSGAVRSFLDGGSGEDFANALVRAEESE